MKFRYKMLIACFVWWILLGILVFPAGYDVGRASKARDQVESILVKSGCRVEGENEPAEATDLMQVAMTVEKWGTAVVILNPKPDDKTIREIIHKHRHEIDGSSVKIIFEDKNNNYTSRITITD